MDISLTLLLDSHGGAWVSARVRLLHDGLRLCGSDGRISLPGMGIPAITNSHAGSFLPADAASAPTGKSRRAHLPATSPYLLYFAHLLLSVTGRLAAQTRDAGCH